ncbi:MAG: DUF11 domain-containing protein, partial [Thermoplasmata archaeon]|nr:DUF11 domain-containing protein [Thermoplasmata archaeon]
IVGQNISWYLGDVNNSDNKDIKVIFRAIVNNVVANQNGSIIQGNTVEFLGYDFDGNSVTASNSSSTVTIKEPSLSIEKLNDATLPVEGGDAVNYTILVYHNDNSSSDAYNVWINDTLPSKVQLLDMFFVMPPTIDNSAGRFLSFYYERIPLINNSSNPMLILYRVKVLNNITINETLDNNATVEWTSVNSTFGNESYERKGEHTALNDYNDYDMSSIKVKNASIKLIKTVWNGSAWVNYYHQDIGENVTFNITVINTGEASLVNITITDVLPSGLINSTWGNSNTWFYSGPLPSGESIYIEFNATVSDSEIEINFANVTASLYNITGRVYDEDTATIEGENASIMLTKTVWNGSSWVDYHHEDVGENVTFNITIINTGTNPIADVNITDVLPSGLINSTWGDRHSWHIPLLEIGGSYTIIFNASIIQAGIHTNYANVTGYCENTSKPVYDEDTATVLSDNLPPITLKVIGEPKCKSGLCITTHTPIWLNATDNISGVNATYYRIWYDGIWHPINYTDKYGENYNITLMDSKLWYIYYSRSINYSPIYFGEEGKHSIIFFSVDNMGNKENETNQTHCVDDSPPIISKVVGNPKCV